MNTAQKHDTKPTFLDKLSDFLSRHRIPIVVILIVTAVAVVTLFIVLEIVSNRTENALVLAEDLQSSYSDWSALDADAKAAGLDDLVAQITDVTNSYPRTYAAERAMLIHGQMLAALERWKEASEQFVTVADRFPDSYLAPIALMRAAVSFENAGDTVAALDVLNRLVNDNESSEAEVPRALFSIGRIQEGLDNIAEAADTYNKLIDDYPSSSWTNLARDRIITLTVQGRIGS